MYNKYTKLRCLEGLIVRCVTQLKKAAPRFEKGVDPLIFAVSPVKPC